MKKHCSREKKKGKRWIFFFLQKEKTPGEKKKCFFTPFSKKTPVSLSLSFFCVCISLFFSPPFLSPLFSLPSPSPELFFIYVFLSRKKTPGTENSRHKEFVVVAFISFFLRQKKNQSQPFFPFPEDDEEEAEDAPAPALLPPVASLSCSTSFLSSPPTLVGIVTFT